MRNLKTLAAVCALATPIFALTLGISHAQKAPEAVASTVVAKVDGISITEQDMILASQEIGAQIQNMPLEQQRRVLIEFLIENQLVATAATTQKLGDTSGYKARIDYWQRRSLRDTFFEANIETAVDDKAAKAFYDEQVAKSGAGGEEIRAAHILVKEETEAKEIFEALAHDGDFAELASKHSLDPGSKVQGGDLGYFGKGRMVPEFEKVAFALKKDEVSQPVQSQFGWHIIKLTDRRTQQPPPFEQLKDRIRMVLIRQQATQVVDGFRKKANIEYVDPEIKAMVDATKADKK